jgi:hypothetical protein
VIEVELARWIEDLRARLAAGGLVGLAPFDLGEGTGRLSGELTVGVMLADLDHLAYLPASTSRRGLRLDALMDDFRRLRIMLGAHPTRNGVR